MNWKQKCLGKLRWQILLLGAIAGAWGALLYESCYGALLLAGAGTAGALVPTLGLGAGLGATLAPLDEFLGHLPGRSLRAAGYGAGLGLLAAGIGLAPLSLLTAPAGALLQGSAGDALLWYWACLPVPLALLGAAVGLASGLGAGNGMLGRRRALWGAVAGLVLGIPVALLGAWLPTQPWVHWLALVAWSALLALALFWREKRYARRWLRMLTAPGEDWFFPLLGKSLRVGKLERNDIVLPRHREIFPVHCKLRWNLDHYDIVDDEEGGTVMVNFRQVQEQALKSGDVIKIGAALLQYGEAT